MYRSLTETAVTMPVEARELVFLNGVPVQIIELIDNNLTLLHEKPKPSDTTVNPAKTIKTEQADVLKATDGDQTTENDTNPVTI